LKFLTGRRELPTRSRSCLTAARTIPVRHEGAAPASIRFFAGSAGARRMSPTQAEFRREHAPDMALLAQVREAFLPALGEAFAVAVARYDDVLFDRAERAGASQLLFLDGMRELRRQRDTIASRFGNQLALAWRSLEEGAPLSAVGALS